MGSYSYKLVNHVVKYFLLHKLTEMALTSQKNNSSSYLEVFPINFLPLLINYHLFRETQKVTLVSIFYHFYSQQGSFPELGLSKTKNLCEIPVKYINALEISTVCQFQTFLTWTV